jgi:glutathione S-transferase
MTARYELHGIFPSGPTYKVALLLKLAGTPYDYVHVDLRSGAHKQPDYMGLNRFGVVPTLIDRSTGAHLAQSSVILEDLATTLGKFNGSGDDERRQAREWIIWGWDNLSRGIYRTRAYRAGFRKAPADVVEHYRAEGEGALKALDGYLAGKDWICGGSAPTFADIDLFGVAVYAGQAGFSLEALPNLAAWIKRIEALPGYDGPDTLLPKESRKAG